MFYEKLEKNVLKQPKKIILQIYAIYTSTHYLQDLVSKLYYMTLDYSHRLHHHSSMFLYLTKNGVPHSVVQILMGQKVRI